MDFSGQTIMITGASSGIGTAYAEAFAARKANLILVARSGTVLRQLAERLRERHGIEATVREQDLSQPGAAAALKEQHPHLDGLLNNAGFGTSGLLAGQSEQDQDRTREEIRLNCGALVDLSQVYLPGMVARGRGFIVNVASTAAFQPIPKMAVYSATKAFVLSFSQALWGETQGTGVRVLAVCPGPTSTRFFENAGNTVVTGRMRSVEEVVRTTFRGLDRSTHTVVDGAVNRLATFFGRTFPRRLVIALAGRLIRT